MQDNNDPRDAITRVLAAVLGWIGSLTLDQVQTSVAIVSGLIVAGYGLTQWYVLWRDKIRRKPRRRP